MNRGRHLIVLLMTFTCFLPLIVVQAQEDSCPVKTEQDARFYKIFLAAKSVLWEVTHVKSQSITILSEPILSGADGVKSECFPGREYAARLLNKYAHTGPRANDSDVTLGQEQPFIGNPSTWHVGSAVRTGDTYAVAALVEQKVAVCASSECDSLQATRVITYKDREKRYASDTFMLFPDSRGLYGWSLDTHFLKVPHHTLEFNERGTKRTFKCKSGRGWPTPPGNFSYGANFCFLSRTGINNTDKYIDEFYEIDFSPNRLRGLSGLNGDLNFFTWTERHHFETEEKIELLTSKTIGGKKRLFNNGTAPAYRGMNCFWNSQCSCGNRDFCNEGKGRAVTLVSNKDQMGSLTYYDRVGKDDFEKELISLLTDPSGASNVSAPEKVTNFEISLSQMSLFSLELWIGQNDILRSRYAGRKSGIVLMWLVTVLFSLIEVVPTALLLYQEWDASAWRTGNTRVSVRAISGKLDYAFFDNFESNMLSVLEANWVYRYKSTRVKVLAALLGVDVLAVIALRLLVIYLHRRKQKRILTASDKPTEKFEIDDSTANLYAQIYRECERCDRRAIRQGFGDEDIPNGGITKLWKD